MAKILQIINVDASGHYVRLDDGRYVMMPHSAQHPQVGEEFEEDAVDTAGEPEARQESEQSEEKAPVE